MSARLRAVLGVVVIAAASVAVIASGSDNKAEKVDSGGNADSSTTGGNSPTTFKVGDEVKLGDWTVKVWGVQDPYTSTNQFAQPTPGGRFVLLDTEVKNTGNDAKSVSSLLCFKVQDSANREYTEDIASGAQPGPPDGEVPPGQAKRGNVVFDIPADATGLKLNFKCDLLDSGTATIQLS